MTDEGSAFLPEEGESTLKKQEYGISAFRAQKESGFTWRRVLVFFLQIVPSVPLAGWLLFSASPFGLPEGNAACNTLVFTWIMVVLLAYEAKLLYIERRFMIIEVFFVFVLPVLFPALIVYMIISTRKNDNPISTIDFLAGIFVVFGTFLNTWPEVMRMHWKRRSENKGKLYTKGYFAHLRNPNYLGDVIWATGYWMGNGL